MGKLRTINHPGIEIQEVDMSGSTEQVGGCTTLVMGFFPQGESAKPVNPTSMAAVKSYFGTPENEAERYAYYACKSAFDNRGNLVAARIPYNNNSQYLTPATKYNIREWSTKHVSKYSPSYAKMVVNDMTADYSETRLDDTTSPSFGSFTYTNGNPRGIGVYMQDKYTTNYTAGQNVGKKTTEVLAISSANYEPTADSIGTGFYAITFNPLWKDVTNPFGDDKPSSGVLGDDNRTISVVVCSYTESGREILSSVETYNDLLAIPESELGRYDDNEFICNVSDSFSENTAGYYLSGSFESDSCFVWRNVNVLFDMDIPNTAEGLATAAESVSGRPFDAIVFAGTDAPTSKPIDTVDYYDSTNADVEPGNVSYLPVVAPRIEENGETLYVLEYTSSNGTVHSRTQNVVTFTDGSIAIKVIHGGGGLSNGDPAPDMCNFTPVIGSETSDGSGIYNITWVSDGNTDGYYVYDRASGASDKWRPFWNYFDEPHEQWVPTVVNKYDTFRFAVMDSLGSGSGGFSTTNSALANDEPCLTNDSNPALTSTITASLKTGELTFKTDVSNGDGTSTSYSFGFNPLFNKIVNSPRDANGRYNPSVDNVDVTFLTEENAKYFNIDFEQLRGWNSSVRDTGDNTTVNGFYSETLCSENKSDFFYEPTRSSPVTAFVDSYAEYGTEKVIAIKSYYKSGEGTRYPEIGPDDYLCLRIWDEAWFAGKSLSALTEANQSKFDIIRREYVGVPDGEPYMVLNESGFKCAPLSTDVTVGYFPKDENGNPIGYVNSDSLAIDACTKGSFNEENYPQIEDRDPFGTGMMKVLKYVRDSHTIEFNPNDFYQFVSPYTRIKDVAEAASQKYTWVHWYTPSSDETSVKKGLLLSRTLGCEVADVPVQLSDVENLVTIEPDVDHRGFIPLSEYQDYRDEAKKPERNTIVIANITEQKFGSDTYNNMAATDDDASGLNYADEVLGIMPVLMGGFQSLPRQSRIELPKSITNAHLFNAVESVIRGCSIEDDPAPSEDHVDIKAVTLNGEGFVRTLGTTGEYDAYDSTYSNQLLGTVPPIDLNGNYKPNGSKMNYVTLAVCKLTLSKVNDNRIAVTVLESFTGSLDKNAKDESGNSAFIDDVVNNEDTGSSYVRLFSNYETTLTGQRNETQSVREYVAPATNDTKVTLAVPMSLGEKLWWTKSKPSMSLGFTNEQTKKYISYATIAATIENVFDSLSNVDDLDLDVVVDAGLSTIANRIKRITDANPEKTKSLYEVFWENISDVDKVAGWKSICSKLTTFCQTTRKDCITLLDAPRNLCVKDNVKLVQPSGKYSVDYDILPKFNYIGSMNSSYAAGYCDWLAAVDDFSSKTVWLPPSIAAAGAVAYTDFNSNYWMPPAGQNRGNVTWAVDVAFNPSAAQQDSIYSKGWNYAISSSGSIMVWGQKTMLNSTSSFNRINIRRLFCRLERLTRKNSKWVIFEINNERTRNIYKDRIDPIFANVKAMGGIYDYEIHVGSNINTPTVVQNNEFRAAFLVKPEHAAEYIILTFFNMNQDMDFSEAYSQF